MLYARVTLYLFPPLLCVQTFLDSQVGGMLFFQPRNSEDDLKLYEVSNKFSLMMKQKNLSWVKVNLSPW